MSEEKKVISLFSREAIGPEHTDAPAAAPGGFIVPKQIDQQSVETLNRAIEAVLNGTLQDILIIGTNVETKLPYYHITFGKNRDPQVDAIRYLGSLRAFEDVLVEIVHSGVEVGQK